VASYAHELCVTPNHLSERIRQETGRPASEHIRQRVMQEARHLLTAPDVQLKQVAYELGFEDTAHFGKLFKRCHGMSFSDFRARQLG
jgi:AraC family transcriptional activator of pobA